MGILLAGFSAEKHPFGDVLIGGMVILLVLLLPLLLKNLKWYEPIVAMNCMVFLFACDLIYLGITGFSRAEHLLHSFPNLGLITTTIVLFTSSWLICFILGYSYLRQDPGRPDLDLPIIAIDVFRFKYLLKYYVSVCFLIAIGNLLYNVWLFNSGGIVEYLLDFGVARHRVQLNPGRFTTLGYNLFIVALILYRISMVKWSFPKLLIYFSLTVVTLIAFISRGQIFYTFSVIAFLFIFEMFLSKRRAELSKWFLILAPLIISIMLVSYAMRIVSVEFFLAQGRGDTISYWTLFVEKLSDMLHLIFGKGNAPNLPAALVYWEHYGNVEPWFNGASMLNWLGGVIPGYKGSYIGYHISDTWYPNNVGGIPPGIILEFFSNFGIVGSLVSAFLFGGISALAFNSFIKHRNLMWGIMFAALLVRFWFIVPKVEMAVLNNAIWLFLPTTLILILVKYFDYIFSHLFLKTKV